MKVNRALLVNFAEVVTTDSFEKKFSVLALKVRHFLEGVIKLDISDARSTYKIMKIKADTTPRALSEVDTWQKSLSGPVRDRY